MSRHRASAHIVIAVTALALTSQTSAGRAHSGLARLDAAQQLTVANRIVGSKEHVTSGQFEAAVLSGDVNLTQVCDDASILRGAITECSVEALNTAFEPRVVDVDSFISKHLDVLAATGATRIDSQHVQATNVILAAAQPGVPGVEPGSLAGYIPLDVFGVTPMPIGDEEFINLSTPPFLYAGQTWTTLGVNSNGYIVVGGGSTEDNSFSPPGGPHPDKPNNVLAPFWTDLTGDSAPGIFAAELTDGVDSWIVIESRLNVFGSTSLRVFQVWIGINGVEDITFAYDPANLPAAPGAPFLVGAENVLGQGEMTSVLPTQDLRVTSSAFVPGGALTFSFVVQGAKQGDGTVSTQMEVAGVPGVALVETLIQVLKAKQ